MSICKILIYYVYIYIYVLSYIDTQRKKRPQRSQRLRSIKQIEEVSSAKFKICIWCSRAIFGLLTQSSIVCSK